MVRKIYSTVAVRYDALDTISTADRR